MDNSMPTFSVFKLTFDLGGELENSYYFSTKELMKKYVEDFDKDRYTTEVIIVNEVYKGVE